MKITFETDMILNEQLCFSCESGCECDEHYDEELDEYIEDTCDYCEGVCECPEIGDPAELVDFTPPDYAELSQYSKLDFFENGVISFVLVGHVVKGRITCEVSRELTGAELEALREEIRGSLSDGYGEVFEQQEIVTGMNISFDWKKIRTIE